MRSLRVPQPSFGASVGALMSFTLFALVRPFIDGGGYGPRAGATGYSYTWFVLAMFIPYGLAVHAVRRDGRPSLRAVLIVAAIVSIPLVVAPLIQSQDLFQYLDYARLQIVHHANPYLVPPDAFAHDPWFRYVAWPDQRSVYGPLWSLAMAGVATAARSSLVRAMFLAKALALMLEVVALWGLIALGRGARRALVAVAVAGFALNPLVLSSVALSGHADIAVAAAIVWAIVADRRDRPMVSVLLLTAATLVKAYAGLTLAVYLVTLERRLGARRLLKGIAFSAGLVVVAYLPYWRGLGTLGGLISIVAETSSSLAGSVAKVSGAILSGLDVKDPARIALAAVRVAGIAILAATFFRTLRSDRRHRVTDPWPAAMALMAVYLLVTPWFLPWHAVGALALACAIPESPLSEPGKVFSASCLASVAGPGPMRPIATSAIRYGPPTISYLRRTREPRCARRLVVPAGSVAMGPPRSRGGDRTPEEIQEMKRR